MSKTYPKVAPLVEPEWDAARELSDVKPMSADKPQFYRDAHGIVRDSTTHRAAFPGTRCFWCEWGSRPGSHVCPNDAGSVSAEKPLSDEEFERLYEAYRENGHSVLGWSDEDAVKLIDELRRLRARERKLVELLEHYAGFLAKDGHPECADEIRAVIEENDDGK